MKAVVTGTDYVRNYPQVTEFLNTAFADGKPDLIVCGNNHGADLLAKRYAKHNGIKAATIIDGIPLPGHKHNIKRNKVMVDGADLVVVFWAQQTFKLKNVVEMAMKKGIKTILFEIKKPSLTRGKKPAITTDTQTQEEI